METPQKFWKSLKNIGKFLKNNCPVKSGNPSKILGNASK